MTTRTARLLLAGVQMACAATAMLWAWAWLLLPAGSSMLLGALAALVLGALRPTAARR